MITPCGKRRLMVAQTTPDPMSESAGDINLDGVEPGNVQFAEDKQTDPASQSMGDVNEVEKPVDELESNLAEQESHDADGDLRKTIFNFLVGLGYPPRRLQEFKSQFVSESGTANAGANVTIVVPDEVYGKNVQIPRDKLKELVQLIERNHGLSFQNYKRANEQLTLDFITEDAARAQSMDDSGPGDILDKVYGKSPGSKGKKNPKNAQTIQELIKESKDKQYQTLKMIMGQYASKN